MIAFSTLLMYKGGAIKIVIEKGGASIESLRSTGIGLDCTNAVPRNFEQHTDDSTIWLGPPPILRENILGMFRGLKLSFFSISLRRGLVARRLFKEPPCCEFTIHLQASMSPPGLEPRPKEPAVILTNHNTITECIQVSSS
ncbi:hypothetical protein TNCV_695391 [Trichonephila clavipes]|nr:hypothetical protein TNCV_695391 [Trichonephila clavipes]